MPSFDFTCPQCGDFDELFLPAGTEWYWCPECNLQCEKVWKTIQFDRLAFGFWNNDTNRGAFSDKAKWEQHLNETGRRIKEPGTDADAERISQYNWERDTKQLGEDVGAWVQDHSIDELRKGICTDAAIVEAQQKGDLGTLKEMRVPTSLDEAYEKVNS